MEAKGLFIHTACTLNSAIPVPPTTPSSTPTAELLFMVMSLSQVPGSATVPRLFTSPYTHELAQCVQLVNELHLRHRDLVPCSVECRTPCAPCCTSGAAPLSGPCEWTASSCPEQIHPVDDACMQGG